MFCCVFFFKFLRGWWHFQVNFRMVFEEIFVKGGNIYMDLWHSNISHRKVPIKKWAKLNHFDFSSNCDLYSFEDKFQSKCLRASVCHPRVISRQPRKSPISKIRSWNWNCNLINVFIKQLPPLPNRQQQQ